MSVSVCLSLSVCVSAGHADERIHNVSECSVLRVTHTSAMSIMRSHPACAAGIANVRSIAISTFSTAHPPGAGHHMCRLPSPSSALQRALEGAVSSATSGAPRRSVEHPAFFSQRRVFPGVTRSEARVSNNVWAFGVGPVCIAGCCL